MSTPYMTINSEYSVGGGSFSSASPPTELKYCKESKAKGNILLALYTCISAYCELHILHFIYSYK